MSNPSRQESFQPAALFLAFVLPGLGHAYLGERRRGLYIGLGVLGLFIGGMLIGGVDVVDRRTGRQEDLWRFAGQAPVGPLALGVDYVHQRFLKRDDRAIAEHPGWLENHRPARTRSIGHVNEVGSLYTVMAGMLNAICMIDAGWHGETAPVRSAHSGVGASGRAGRRRRVMLTMLLGYRPFLDPIALPGASWWFTLIPLAFGIAMVYKAVRMRTMDRYWMQVIIMTLQIVGVMLGLAIGVHLLVEWCVPLLETFLNGQ